MEIQRDKAVCFTGHRPTKLGGYNESNPTAQHVKQRLRDEILRAIDDGYTTFISGMALGVDMWAAEIVLSLRSTNPTLKLVAAVPFDGQERKWPTQSQVRWRDIVVRADDVAYVCEPGYAAWKMQKRNEWMVDHSSRVIAVWDGTSGGTGNCVKYAEKASHSPDVARIDLPRYEMPKRTRCVHITPWYGQCRSYTNGGDLCEDHSMRKCVVCGDTARTCCDHMTQYMCGQSLCGKEECRREHFARDVSHR